MVYQCHLTTFVILHPLTSKRAAEVAFQLIDIFLLFGAPSILQIANRSECTAQFITELKEPWPCLIMVQAKVQWNVHGSDPKVGLISPRLPSQVLERPQTENYMIALFPAHAPHPTPAPCTQPSAYASTCRSYSHHSAYTSTCSHP